ncbi:MAG: hypothetical protein U9R32_07465 [Bacteroidota bacterium]|nr:hypothetical protein [Bacteroidota bacterium]
MTHNGGYDGMISQTVFVPEENLGFVILTNSLSSMYSPLIYKTLDVYLSNDKTDWSKMFLSYNKAGQENAKELEKKRRHRK